MGEAKNFKVTVDSDDLVNVTVWGRWEIDDVAPFMKAIDDGLTELTKKHKPRLILYDARGLNMMSFAGPRTRSKMVELFAKIKFDELADFGVTSLVVSVAKLFARISANVAKIRFFVLREEAVDFLKKRQSELMSR